MKNIERLKLELANKSYFADDEYSIFLEENGLIPSTIYNGASDKLGLLQTVLSIFESLQNNIDLYRSIETEFTTTSSAYENIKTRIDELHKQIAKLPSYQPTTKSITYLFHN